MFYKFFVDLVFFFVWSRQCCQPLLKGYWILKQVRALLDSIRIFYNNFVVVEWQNVTIIPPAADLLYHQQLIRNTWWQHTWWLLMGGKHTWWLLMGNATRNAPFQTMLGGTWGLGLVGWWRWKWNQRGSEINLFNTVTGDLAASSISSVGVIVIVLA